MTQHISLLAFDECLASAVVGAKDLFGAANMIAAQLDPRAAIPFQIPPYVSGTTCRSRPSTA